MGLGRGLGLLVQAESTNSRDLWGPRRQGPEAAGPFQRQPAYRATHHMLSPLPGAAAKPLRPQLTRGPGLPKVAEEPVPERLRAAHVRVLQRGGVGEHSQLARPQQASCGVGPKRHQAKCTRRASHRLGRLCGGLPGEANRGAVKNSHHEYSLRTRLIPDDVVVVLRIGAAPWGADWES